MAFFRPGRHADRLPPPDPGRDGVPERPANLSPEGAAEWERLAGLLAGVITRRDGPALRLPTKPPTKLDLMGRPPDPGEGGDGEEDAEDDGD